MDIVAAEKELRSSTSFDDIHLLWDELFGVTGYNFALFSQGAEFADRVMSETDKNVVSLFQLKSFYFSLPRACLQTSYRSQISEAARHTKAAKTSASLS